MTPGRAGGFRNAGPGLGVAMGVHDKRSQNPLALHTASAIVGMRSPPPRFTGLAGYSMRTSFRAAMANHFMRCITLALLTLGLALAIVFMALLAAAAALIGAACSFAMLL